MGTGTWTWTRSFGVCGVLLALGIAAGGCETDLTLTDPDPAEEVDNQQGNPTAGQPAPEAVLPNVTIDGPGTVSLDTVGATVVLTATPNPRFAFLGWSGSTASDRNPLTLYSLSTTTLVAHFGEQILDQDHDGVRDEHDECPNTVFGRQTDPRTGCACDQLDDDEDGRNNCDDECPNTPAGEYVDELGCSCSQYDDDGDGVSNCHDLCPDTRVDEGAANEEGCGPAQRDTDVDGVKDSNDDCPDTPFGTQVNDRGCPPVCGNELVEFGEDCDPPDGIDCDDLCNTIIPVCGNGIVQAGEECDPPDGETCDSDCQHIPTAVCGDGVVEEDEECDPPNGVTCDANCRWIVGTGCGTGSCLVANGTPGCDDQACCDVICCAIPSCCTVEWDEVCAAYASLVCVSGPCAGGTGDCRSANGTPGCNDEPCCNYICSFDPYCCTVEWDVDCAFLAVAIAVETDGCLCNN